MSKRAINMYEFIFGAFFILKVTGEGIQNWNWFFVFLPLVIGFIHTFFIRVYENTGMKRDTNAAMQDMYLNYKRNKVVKAVKKDFAKKT